MLRGGDRAYSGFISEDASLGTTPDFYTYEPCPIERAGLEGEWVVIGWPDGAEMRAYGLWLFENRMGDGAIDEATREGTLDPAELPEPSVLRAAEITPAGDLCVTWAGVVSSVHHSGWLRHVHDGRHRAGSGIPGPERWTAASICGAPPTFDGPPVLSDDDALEEWLVALTRYGVARLRGLAPDESTVGEVGARIGALRDTNFGVTWPVSVDLSPVSTANTPLPLMPHTDLPTRETPPGFQLLHCRINACEGGLSHMTDGYAIAERLQTTDPEAYAVLCRAKWVFFNRSRDHDHRWTGPVIDHGVPGSPLTLRAFHPVRGFPAMADEDLPAAYAALRAFSRLAGSEEFQIRYAFQPGDLVAFDNRRILHGRGVIGERGGTRVLHGCYVDHDEVFSRLRVLTRRKEVKGKP